MRRGRNSVILIPEKYWECPNCDDIHITREALPHTPFHSCRGLKGLTAPFVPKGTNCKVEANEWEDYIGKEAVSTDIDGRPIMNIVTTRDEGQDCAVLAPCATGDRNDE